MFVQHREIHDEYTFECYSKNTHLTVCILLFMSMKKSLVSAFVSLALLLSPVFPALAQSITTGTTTLLNQLH